jgi:hypothetical protein
MKIKFIVFTVIVLTIHSVFGQKTRAELIFKDGTMITGLAEPTNVGNIRFRKNRKAKKIFYSFEEVDTLKVYYDFNPTLFVLVKVQDKAKPQVLEMARHGKNVTYFRDVQQGYAPPVNMPMAGGGVMQVGGGFYSLSNSYVRKANSSEAIYLGSSSWLSKNFRKAAMDFFSDCAKLSKKIESREFKKRDLKEIIEYYNGECE